MMEKTFLVNKKNNDEAIVEYLLRNTGIKSEQCINYFCSEKFNIDYNKCVKNICQPKNI